MTGRLFDHTHGFYEKYCFPCTVANRHCLDIDMLLPVRCVMKVQNSVNLTTLHTHTQRTGLPGLITRRGKTMRHLITMTAGNGKIGRKCL